MSGREGGREDKTLRKEDNGVEARKKKEEEEGREEGRQMEKGGDRQEGKTSGIGRRQDLKKIKNRLE